MNISEVIKEIKETHNLSQDRLAKILGVSQKAISNWENGVDKPNLDSVLVLYEKFNITPNELLGLDSKYGNAQKPPVKTEGYFKLKTQSKSEIELLFNQLSREQQSRVLGIVEGILIQDGKDINSILGRNAEHV